MSLDQLLNAFGQCRIEPRWHRSQYRARPQPGAGKSALDILCASTRRVTSPSLVGRPRRRRALPRGLPQNVQVHGQLAHLALEPIDLFLAQCILLFRPRAQGVLRAEQKALPSLLHLGYFKSMPPCCLSCCRLTSEHADYQGCATLRRPALYFLGLLFVCHLPPRQVS